MGLIPAHAGKTPSGPPPPSSARAHPRSRGENKALGAEKTRLRLIPAHAGKTGIFDGVFDFPRAHPRSRGENHRFRRRCGGAWGSSPLTRGKRRCRRRRRDDLGLIPAHAGKTQVSARLRGATRAHPRSRGENGVAVGRHGEACGSSPLTRGKHVGHSEGCRLERLIPAHAGKTGFQASLWDVRWAHPRSRGENGLQGCDSFGAKGSSPLTRGKRVPRRARQTRGRLIPAHAGKTSR